MNLRRLLMSALCAGSLLIQTTAFAWSPLSVLPHKAATEQAMPCHGGAATSQDRQGTHHCCCHDQCSCEDFCAGTSAALPSLPSGLEQLIAAHVQAMTTAPVPLPTRSHPRFRPPISNPS